MTREKTNEPIPLFQEVEERASSLPVQLIRLTDKDAGDIGLVIYGNDAAEAMPGALRQVISTIQANTGDRFLASAGANLDRALPRLFLDQGIFRQTLAGELERIRNSRLPCTLMLIGFQAITATPEKPPGGKTDLAPLAGLIHATLSRSCQVGHGGGDVLAIILPETNLGRGLGCAEAILEAFRKNLPPGPGYPVPSAAVIGMVVCHVFDNYSADTLLKKAEAELKRAGKKGPGAICYHTPRPDQNFCQVTVEERAEIFRPFGKNGP